MSTGSKTNKKYNTDCADAVYITLRIVRRKIVYPLSYHPSRCLSKIAISEEVGRG